MRIGIAGLGRMGAAMAARLMEVGHELTVWNRSPDKTKPLTDAGAAAAATPAELAGRVEAIITILTDAKAVDAVYRGPSGLLSENLDGKLVIEMSTVRPETEIALARGGARQGRRLRRMPGRRHHRAGARRQAHRPRRRRGRGRGAGAADPRGALPPHRACRPGRRRRQHEARHQPAAARLLPGARRGLCPVPPPRSRPQRHDGPVRRHLGRAQHAEAARSGHRRLPVGRVSGDADLRPRFDPQGSAHHAGGGRSARLRPAPRAAGARRLRRGERCGLGQARRGEPACLLVQPRAQA